MTVQKNSFENVPEARRRIMRAIKSSDTKPEKLIRSLLHKGGYRFRKNVASLPGRPDVVFKARKKVIFVHGCYWHSHSVCMPIQRVPKERSEYWAQKFARTKERDQENVKALKELGWSVLVIWECELKDIESLLKKVTVFLNG